VSDHNETSISNNDTGVPAWAMAPFEDFINLAERIVQLLHLSTCGLSIMVKMPALLRSTVKGAQGELEVHHIESLQRVERVANLAQREVDDNFPLLHAYSVIGLWSSLESTIRLFVANWLQHSGHAMNVEAVQKLRVKIGEYESLSGQDKYFYLLDRIEQETATNLLNGVNKFESLLGQFGLSGPVEERVKRALFEMGQVRNVIVHRSSIADRRFVEACPWLQLNVGDTIKISYDQYINYYESSIYYMKTVMKRLPGHFNKMQAGFGKKPSG
jgi:hypothetical protein